MNAKKQYVAFTVAPHFWIVLVMTIVSIMLLTRPVNAETNLVLPGFNLPWDKSLNGTIVYTGGPHAYNTPALDATFPSGVGSGLDFAGGSFKVLAMADGVVEDVDTSCSYAGFGCVIAIRHSVGQSVILYAHLQPGSFQVAEGQSVKSGDWIATAGNSGMENLPENKRPIHLHVELRDGAATCTVASKYCIRAGSSTIWGNPIDWGDLLVPIDGYTFTSHYVDGDGISSYNYDGSAIKGPISIFSNFKYVDRGTTVDGVTRYTLRTNAVARVHSGFTCDVNTASNCEVHSNPTDAVGTQFAGGGRFADAGITAATANVSENYGGQLVSSNALRSSQPAVDTTPPYVASFNVSINGGTAALSVSGVSDNNSGVKEVRYSAKWNNQWYGIGNTYQAPYSLTWNMCNSGVPNGSVEFGVEVWDNAGNVYIWSQHQSNPTLTKSYSCDSPSVTPVPQSCVNIGVFDRQYAYFWSEGNCTGDISWFSAHPSNGPGASRQKSVFVPTGAVLLISSENDGNGRRGCLANSIQNLADVGWENSVEWAQLSYNGCPQPPPVVTPPPDDTPVSCASPGNVITNPSLRNSVFSSNGPAVTIAFGWNFATNVTGYQFQVARDSTFQQIVYDYHTALSWTVADFGGGSYFARVRGENVTAACNLQGGWSDLGTFSVEISSCINNGYNPYLLIWYRQSQCHDLRTATPYYDHYVSDYDAYDVNSIYLADGYSLKVFNGPAGTGESTCLSSTSTNLSTHYYDNSDITLSGTIESYMMYNLPACQEPPLPPPPVPPASPENLRQVGMAEETITFAWDDRSDNEDFFALERWDGSLQIWYSIGTIDKNGTTFVLGDRQCGMTDVFRVMAATYDGGRGYSDWIVAYTAACPEPLAAPKGLGSYFTVTPGETFTLTWEPVAGATLYGVNFSLVDTESGGIDVNSAPYVTTYINAPGQYRWRVYARNDRILGPWSEWGYFSVENVVLPAPTGLTPHFSATLGEEFDLSWNAVPGAARYSLRIESIDRPEPWAVNYVSNGSSVKMAHATAGQYRWRVCTDSETLTSGPWSEWAYYTVVDVQPEIVLPAPTGLTPRFSARLGEEFDLSWKAVPGAVRYSLRIESIDQLEQWAMDYVSNGSSMKMAHSIAGQYRWRVGADSETLTRGPWSEWAYYAIDSSPTNSLPVPLAGAATSTALPLTQWQTAYLVDGKANTVWSSNGHGEHLAGAEWAAVVLPSATTVSSLSITPRQDPANLTSSLGFPKDFVVQYAYNGDGLTCNPAEPAFNYPSNWRPLVTRFGFPQPSNEPVTFAFKPVNAQCFRIFGAELSQDDYGNRYLQLAEVELFNGTANN